MRCLQQHQYLHDSLWHFMSSALGSSSKDVRESLQSLRHLMCLLTAPRTSCLGQPPSFCVVPCPPPLSTGTRGSLRMYRHCSPEGSHQSCSLTFYRRWTPVFPARVSVSMSVLKNLLIKYFELQSVTMTNSSWTSDLLKLFSERFPNF